MRKRISARFRKFISCTEAASGAINNSTPPDPAGLNLREEYANAFRTESYVEFWARVFSLSNADSTIPTNPTTAARLPSYRLFAEHLLDPDQPTITRILASASIQPPYQSILCDYFIQTANASLLCGLLLKDIDRTRVIHRSLRTTTLLTQADFVNPFVSTASSPTRVRAIQANCLRLLKQLESSRDKARVQLRLVNRLERGSAVFLVALTASVAVIVAAHVITLLVAMPGLIVASLELVSARGLARAMAQLDAAAKGTYILNRDLDTISQQVGRLNDELEHMRAMVKFWIERKEDELQANEEVARQLKKNDCSFRQQLDELEEHLYLCFMTINRARNLVVKEIMQQPG
ncbi:hypothetical protein I3843_01G218600 [Carya illinoinensis]|uniref:Uncharacterized protein n=1 Tax=Carya illinoinensis TaxID=32201 RepID=A0A8T1RTH3_CARIL|nr:UPF0496 protein At3g49070 [Carya illinoinensis]KAG2728861.1 hypothetical protein I3760_01G223500 [Carya illinoinensis]KAG6669201.1 hypothetical protein CIPAW_01G227000 [Carya illinoinensis]KAG7997603.1 hypothetical protein I3843_01G218600 [Carya illinoinensis]